MDNNNTSEELFTKVDDLDAGDFLCYVASDRTEIELGSTWMCVDQARAVRDWLNKVLP